MTLIDWIVRQFLDASSNAGLEKAFTFNIHSSISLVPRPSKMDCPSSTMIGNVTREGHNTGSNREGLVTGLGQVVSCSRIIAAAEKLFLNVTEICNLW